MVGEPAEEERADRPRGQGQEDRLRDRLDVGPELLGDRLEHEDHQEEVERVERPAEIARPDRAALRRLERFQVGDQAHSNSPSRNCLVAWGFGAQAAPGKRGSACIRGCRRVVTVTQHRLPTGGSTCVTLNLRSLWHLARRTMLGSPAAARNPMVGGAAMYPTRNIVQNAVNSKDHTTLVAAVKAAGLVDTLSGAGPFTVFAPTNAAFAKLPAGTVDTLLKPENKATLDQGADLSRRSGPLSPPARSRRSPRATTARRRSRPSKARTCVS